MWKDGKKEIKNVAQILHTKQIFFWNIVSIFFTSNLYRS